MSFQKISNSAIGLVLPALLSLAFLSGCKDDKSAQPPQGGMPPAPPVSVAPAISRMMAQEETFTGRLEATQSVELRSRVAGEIVKIHFRDGEEVKRGQLLFSIDARPYKAELARAQAQLAAAQSANELAKAELARGENLITVKAISKQELETQQSAAKRALADILAAEAAVRAAQLNVDYSEIHAPISGRISRAQLTEGNLTGVGEPVLTTIAAQDKVYAYFDASELAYLNYIKKLPTQTAARAGTVLMGLANEQGFPHSGHINFVDNRVNPQSATMRIRAVFDNNERHLTPGLFARLKLVGGEAQNVVMIPDRAINTDQTKKFVLVVGDDKIAQYRPIELGTVIDGMRVVTSGLQAGEKIIVNGLQRAHPGAPVTPELLEVDAKGMPIEKAPQQTQKH